MVAGRHTEVSVSPVSTARLWKASGDTQSLIPKLLPHVIKSIDLIEGDGGVGSVNLFTFAEGMKVSYVKDRIDVLDHENHVFKYTVVEGGMLGKTLKASSFEHRMEPTGEGGTMTTLNWEYETLGDGPLSPEEVAEIVGGVMGLSKAIEGHLTANPDAYL